MRYVIWVIVIIIILVGAAVVFTRSAEAPEQSIPAGDTPAALDAADISERVARGEAVLFDVRTAEEREADGYAFGSTHFDVARLEAGEVPNISLNVPLYVYCKAGGRAEKAKDILSQKGFTDITNIGGLSDWEAAGGEVVR